MALTDEQEQEIGERIDTVAEELADLRLVVSPVRLVR
jgi:hypothetical protein